jgi:PAS domain S-box-containing protein
MKKQKKISPELSSLRQKAEVKLKKKHPVKESHLTESDTLKLIHELNVHQIELEMQNEELRLARDKAKTATEKYTELYDFAFTGYFTLDRDSKIHDLNLSGAGMLGKERSYLLNRNFKQFVTIDTLSIFNDFIRKLVETNSKETCEARLITKANQSIYVQIEGRANEEEQKYHLIVIDISKRKKTEEILKYKVHELEQFNDHMLVSEQKMIELKKEINRLLKKLGEKEKFKITE